MFHKILVALDNSDNRQQVFNKALDIAKADHADLMVFHALSYDDANCPQIPMGISGAYLGAVEVQAFEEFYKRWQVYEQEQAQLLQVEVDAANAAGIKSELLLQNGPPGRLICDQSRAWPADLIVMGRRGHTGLGELLLGSVSNYVNHHAPCSVLIVQ